MSFATLLEHHDSVASTMAVARLRALDGAPEGTTVSARRQSAGRGRRGRSWFSPEGGLYLTTILRPRVASEQLPQLALVAGLALREACAGLGAGGARLKWPNDVVVGRKKLAGILLETPAPEVVLVGMGLNLRARGALELPEELSLRYLGLADLVGGEPQPSTVGTSLLQHLEARYRRWSSDGFGPLRAEFDRFHALSGTEIRAQIGEHWQNGKVERVDDDGALVIRTQNGVERVRSGEVRYVRPRT